MAKFTKNVAKFTTFVGTFGIKKGYFYDMAKFLRKRQLVDTQTGEEFLSDERISVLGRSAWDRARFVKMFIPGLEALVRLKPSEITLAMYVMTRLKSGSRVVQVEFQGYCEWVEPIVGKKPDRSSYHKAVKGLVGEGWMAKSGKEWLINHNMAFVGDRGRHLVSSTVSLVRSNETIEP